MRKTWRCVDPVGAELKATRGGLKCTYAATNGWGRNIGEKSGEMNCPSWGLAGRRVFPPSQNWHHRFFGVWGCRICRGGRAVLHTAGGHKPLPAGFPSQPREWALPPVTGRCRCAQRPPRSDIVQWMVSPRHAHLPESRPRLPRDRATELSAAEVYHLGAWYPRRHDL